MAKMTIISMMEKISSKQYWSNNARKAQQGNEREMGKTRPICCIIKKLHQS
jgi:hypothetical protein